MLCLKWLKTLPVLLNYRNVHLIKWKTLAFLKISLFSTFHHHTNQVKKAFKLFLQATTNKNQLNFLINPTRLTNLGDTELVVTFLPISDQGS